MKKRRLNSLIITTLVSMVLVGGVGAVEVYRIGAEDEPRPDQPGLNFHQFLWSDFKEKGGLDEEELAQGILRPLFLTPDENVARTSVARGGGPSVVVSGGTSPSVTEASKTMVDGNPGSFYEWAAVKAEEEFITQKFIQWHLITLDLGGLFHVSRVRLFTPQSGHAPDKLDIAANMEAQSVNLGYFRSQSGSGDAAALLPGKLVYRLRENVRDTLDVRFPPALARSLDLLLYRLSPKAITVAEVEVYGGGYINQAFYVGPFIDLKEPAIWGDMRWGGRKDPNARVWIQSRAGKDLDPNVYWRFTGRGDEISPLAENGKPLDAAAYARLKPGEAAQITYDTQNWSFWSPAYEFADSSGSPILSPGPNSVFQARVDFLPALAEGGEVRFIEFSATKPPLAEEVVGEVYPAEVGLGETRQFTYAIRPTIRAQHSGFDQVEIATLFGLMGVDTVKVGGMPVEFSWRVERPDSTQFLVQLPGHLRPEDSGRMIEVVFRAPVLRYGTTFAGWVRDTERPLELAQRINPGNAARDLRSETLTVRTLFSDRLLADLQVEPRVFSPNGDGVNEWVNFSFTVLQVTASVPLKVEIFDLSSRRVQVVYVGQQQSGRFNFSWDGRDGEGRRVAPGLYLYRIVVEAEKGEAQEAGSIAVVY